MNQTKKNISESNRDCLISIISVAVLAVIVGILFDYYYEFNDDVLMKNILSGAYTGEPESHNIQMLWPVSAFISVIYRMFSTAPVYGIFLCACQYGCLILLSYRLLRRFESIRGKIVALSTALLFTACFVMPHLIMVQYTITVAIMAATASFYFYTIPEGLDDREFIKQSIPSICIIILAYQIRSEMLLLMMPYIAITGFVRWNRDNNRSISSFVRYIIVIGCILLGMGISYGADKLAYSNNEWKTFVNEFDARTQLYDYQYVPDYEDNISFYESIGLNKADVYLLTNYDYGLDDKIDGEIISQVAKYAATLRNESLSVKVKTALREYIYRITHFSDGKYQILTAFLYIMLLVAICSRKEGTIGYKLVIIFLRIGGLFAMRSVSWVYIIMGHRAPDRIVHSLYIIECIILYAMFITELFSKLRDKKYICMIAAIIMITGGIVALPGTYTSITSRIDKQAEVNRYGDAIARYCMNNPGNFYFEDVYSTIRDGETFNDKMFKSVNNSIMNYDLIGGWACNSPLYRKKLNAFGINNVAADIISHDNVFVICDEVYSMDWLTDYYESVNLQVTVEKVDTIENTFGVYRASLAETD